MYTCNDITGFCRKRRVWWRFCRANGFDKGDGDVDTVKQRSSLLNGRKLLITITTATAASLPSLSLTLSLSHSLSLCILYIPSGLLLFVNLSSGPNSCKISVASRPQKPRARLIVVLRA